MDITLRADEEVKKVVRDWLAQKLKNFFSSGIYALVKSRRRCIVLYMVKVTVLYLFLH
jgi:hypothetical protein